jgi:ribosomal protein S18 acetylase RimI-like enzyme
MQDLLNNPVYHALTSGDQRLSFGTDKVKFFDEQVSPFASFEEGYDQGFDDLYQLLPSGRVILYATPQRINQPKGWEMLDAIQGLQLVFDKSKSISAQTALLVPLKEQHIEQMMELAKLTKPGPFGPRTIDFGHYYGIFDGDKLVAMTGQRLHVHQFSEVSAVCTHPNHLGKGYASELVQHQVQLIQQNQQIPFLHVREDNKRAIEVYLRLGFKIRGGMNFYVLRRDDK